MKYTITKKQIERIQVSLAKNTMHILLYRKPVNIHENIKSFNVSTKMGYIYTKNTPFINYKFLFLTNLCFIYPINNQTQLSYNCFIKEIINKNKNNSLGILFFNKLYFINQFYKMSTFKYIFNLKLFLYNLKKTIKYFYYKISK
jgi:hypothetical protein